MFKAPVHSAPIMAEDYLGLALVIDAIQDIIQPDNDCRTAVQGIKPRLTGKATNSIVLLDMITKKTKYAFKALMHLAAAPSGTHVLIADLARNGNIPRKFLEFILLSLRKGGLLNSRIGKGGGYSLALPAHKIYLGAVVRILEGDIAPVQCLSSTNYARCEECTDEATCGIRLTMMDVNDALSSLFDTLTLADMINRSAQERSRRQNVVNFDI